MSHIQRIGAFPTVGVDDLNTQISHVSDGDTFGINIDLSGTRKDDVFRFSLLNNERARFILTFIEPVGTIVNMILYIRRANGEGISGYASERISMDRMQGVTLVSPVSGVDGSIIIIANDDSHIDTIIRIDAYN